MVSRLRLCSAIQSARASASATVVIASTRTASYSPKIKVDVIGSKPSGSPKGFGRSPAITFPGAVNTLTPSVLDVMAALTRGVSLVSSRAPFQAGVSGGRHKAFHKISNLIGSRVQCEVPAVDNVDFGVRHILAVAFWLARVKR